MDLDSRPSDAEIAELVALLEVYVAQEGREAYRLTEEGVRVGNMLAMVEGEDAAAVMEAVLTGDGAGPT